jgi:anaerobic magnesium-protoporphyrin IX monomethyl ester cyclase
MKVVLVNPPDEMEQMLGSGTAFVQKYEPLGLLYIAAVLRERGHEVVVIDAYAEALDEGAILEAVTRHAPRVVGFSVLTCNGAIVWRLGQALRERLPELLVVLGNVHASVYAEDYVAHGVADIVVHGEGELVMPEICEELEGERDWGRLEGLSYCDAEGKPQRSAGTNVVKDLSSLPMPARDLVDQSHYGLSNLSNQNYIATGGATAKTLVTSRGCPFRCHFCVVHGNRRPRYNDAQRVVDEMQTLQEDYGASYVYIQDPLFMAHRARLTEICEEIGRRGLTLKWGCDAHVKYVTPEVVKTMERANCYELSLGIESGVQRLLDAVNKGITLDAIKRAVKVIKEHSDIQVEGLFILGLPGETEADSRTTIRFARSLGLDMAQFSVLIPYPGSGLFDELSERGELDTGRRAPLPGQLVSAVDTSVWSRYSSYICFNDIAPIWVTPSLDPERLRRLQKAALRAFYLRPSQVWRQVKRIRPNNLLQMAKVAWDGFF